MANKITAKIKPTEGWAIVEPKGKIIDYSIERTRRNCIAGWIGIVAERNGEWQEYIENGWRCVKVIVSPK